MKEDVRYEIGEYKIRREEHINSRGLNRMMWVLRKDGNILCVSKTWNDLVLEMMIWSADAMEV
tara:strand:- start:783 stop:971 length:189 start_codon:yes stop_codon:yes gene_type:complete